MKSMRGSEAGTAAEPATRQVVLWWTVASVVGGIATHAAACSPPAHQLAAKFDTGNSSANLSTSIYWMMMMFPMWFGGIFTVPQWLVLWRCRVTGAWWWVIASLGGVFFGTMAALVAGGVLFVMTYFSQGTVERLIGWASFRLLSRWLIFALGPGAAAGLVVGGCQYVMLNFTALAGRWIPASALGGLVLSPAVLAVSYQCRPSSNTPGPPGDVFTVTSQMGVIGVIIFTALYGLVTGSALAHILQQRYSDDQPVEREPVQPLPE